MNTTITFVRRNKSGRQLQRHSQQMRSFTENFMELLYIAHAQIQNAAARYMTDVKGAYRPFDSQASTTSQHALKATMILAAPGGHTPVWLPNESNGNNYPYLLGQDQFIPGELIGIQLGSGNTPATPTDRKLVQRIPHGQRAAISPAVSLDSILAGDTNGTSQPSAFYYIPNRQTDCTSIRFLLARMSTPGTITCTVYPVDASSLGGQSVYGPALGSATTNGDTLPVNPTTEWRTFTWASPITLLPGMRYDFYMTQSGSGYCYRRYIDWWGSIWGHNGLYGNIQYPQTFAPWSTDVLRQTGLFDLWGTTPAELEYGGCDIGSYLVSNPTASFIIRRLFRNLSGSDVVVAETGLYAGGTWVTSGGNSSPLCIARDVITPAPITLHNTETLEVTYTPSISV